MTTETTETPENFNRPDSLERFKLYLDLAKFGLSLFFGTVLTSTLTFLISYREVQIKAHEAKIQLQLAERSELERYFRYTMEGNVYDRIKLSEFFGSVLTDKQSRALWQKYSEEQKALLDEYLLLDNPNEVTKNSNKKRTLQALLDPVEVTFANLDKSSETSKGEISAQEKPKSFEECPENTNSSSDFKCLNVPYFSQLDNETSIFGSTDRQSNTSANAMLADFLLKGELTKKAKEEGLAEAESLYMRTVSKYGDTSDHEAQTKALQEWGIESYFSYSLSRLDLIASLEKGIPVVLGMSYATSGTTVLLVGYNPDNKTWIIHDPYGTRQGNVYDVGVGGKFVITPDDVMNQILWDQGSESGWGRIVTKVKEKPTGLDNEL